MSKILSLSGLRTLQAAKAATTADPQQARLDAFKRAKALENLAEARAHLAHSGTYRTARNVAGKVAANG